MKLQINISKEIDFNILLKLQKMIYKMLKRFIKICPEEYKHILIPLQKIPINIFINHKLSNTYAQVCWKGKVKVKEIYMEFQKEISKYDNRQLKLIVAHELGHVIDLLYRGGMCPDHDDVWKNIALCFGAEDPGYIIQNI